MGYIMRGNKVRQGKSNDKIVTIGVGEGITAAAAKMSRHRIGCLVVVDRDGRLAGILSERDIVKQVKAVRPARQVGQIMTRRVVTCPPGTSMSIAGDLMTRHRIRHLPVVQDGRAVGMISSREVMNYQHLMDRGMRDLTIFAMAKLAESRDPDTGFHLDRVRAYAVELCRQLLRQKKFSAELSPDFIQLLWATCPLHDIGKVSIPDCVLLKPGRLDESEFEVMKAHSQIGADTLDLALEHFPKAEFLRMGRSIAAWHHERYDGKGYPDGLTGEDIPLCARIFALADVYDALVSRRVYKEAFTHQIAKSTITQGSKTQFDPVVVEAFLACQGRFDDIRNEFETHKAAA